MKQHKDLIEQLTISIDSLVRKNNEILSRLPVSEQSKVTFISKDINDALKAARNGDMELITKLTNKYASPNNIK